MPKEQEKGGLRKHLIKGAAVALLIPAAVVAARNEEVSIFNDLNLNNQEKTAVTFLVSAEILAVSLFGYRMSDGAKPGWETYGWEYGLPSSNFIGASMLLAEMWR